MQKKMILFLNVALTAAFISVSVVATENEAKAETSPNGGSDSCGLSWQVVKSKTIVGTSTRGTTNGVLNPSWSMTSGTSGCDKHDIAQKDAESVKYVAANYNSIKADMAEGQGEYLVGLARLMGCNDQAVSSFQQMTKKNYKSITSGSDAFETLQNVKGVMSRDASLSASCSSATI